MGKAQRTKGASFERNFAKLLRDEGLDPNARRNVEECQQASTDIKTDLLINFQLKAESQWRTKPSESLAQAAEGGVKGHWDFAVHKIDHKGTFVCMTLEHWLEVMRRLKLCNQLR